MVEGSDGGRFLAGAELAQAEAAQGMSELCLHIPPSRRDPGMMLLIKRW